MDATEVTIRRLLAPSAPRTATAPVLRARGIPVVLGSTLALGVGVMILIAVIACTAPTLRALRIMPDVALREG
jgi:hypothetical protein